MDYSQIELELDAVEAGGAGRIPQEMAKSKHGQGLSPYPCGIHPNLVEHKMAKTEEAVGARVTQVRRSKER